MDTCKLALLVLTFHIHAWADGLTTSPLTELLKDLTGPRIVGICGSQRVGSFNRMLHDHAMTVLRQKGADVFPIELASLDLPLYNPNEEVDNFPEAAKTLKRELVRADGIFIACPEYNGFITPLLLNSITWATRGEGDMYDGFKNKYVVVMATSPGPMGGLRMIRSFQGMLQDMGAIVIPGHNSIGSATKVFSEDGDIVDERTRTKVDNACDQLERLSRIAANREKECEVVGRILKMENMGEYGQVDA